MLVSSAAIPTIASALPTATRTTQPNRNRGRLGAGAGLTCGSLMVSSSNEVIGPARDGTHRTQWPTYVWHRMQEIGSTSRPAGPAEATRTRGRVSASEILPGP